MLILTRRAGEAILIEGGVRIVVLGTEGGGVRLGIEAPPSVGIVREEVILRGTEEKPRAGAGEGGEDGFQPEDGSTDVPPRSTRREAGAEKREGE